MNNERDGLEYKGNLNESKDEIQNKGNKKNNYKYKDGDRNYEYGAYRKHIKKNDYEKGRNNNENSIYNKKNNKKKRESNYEINERYSENIEDFTSELNNHIQQDERTKYKNYTHQQNNISKKSYYNHNNNNNQTNNINNNTNINNSNEQNQDKNINQFNYYQEGQIHDINYINNNNNNNQNGIAKNYNQIINQPQYRKYNNIKQFNNKGKSNNNLSMTTSMMQITSRNLLENQIEQTSNLNIENSQSNNISTNMNSDNLSVKSQSYYSDRSCAPIPIYGNDRFMNNINKPIPHPYEQLYNYNGIPMGMTFFMGPDTIAQNGIMNYPHFTMNQNNIIMNNNDIIKESKKKNNLINKNKGNRSNQGNKTLIPNHNNNTNLNFNNNINGAIFINQNQQIPHYKKNINKKFGLRKLNSDKNIPLNNYSFIPQKNNLSNNKVFNQNNQKDEQIFPFNNLILKLKLPNGNELTDILNINILEENYHNIAQKYVKNNNLDSILIEPIYNKIIIALEMTNSILVNNTSKYDRRKLEELRNYYLIQNEDDELSDCSIDEIIEYNKYYERIKDIKPDKNEIRNFELHNFSF